MTKHDDYAKAAEKASIAAPKGETPVVPIDERVAVIQELNREYAVLLAGDRPVVLKEGIDHASGRPDVRLLSVAGFHEWTRPNVVWKNGAAVPKSKIWLAARERRQYEGLLFDPTGEVPEGMYNLWTGWTVEPSPTSSCQRLIDHIAENVCDGDEALTAWVIGWFAHLFQRPTERLGTSLVLRGTQGTGKTILGKAIGSLLGPHYQLVSDARFVAGRFNAHLVNCLLLQLDEATWGGDHQTAGKLKDLITGDHQLIEFKGREAIRIRNYVRLFVTGNADWLVPAGLEERRFAVLDMAERQRQNHHYFQAIEDELDAGGREALLHYLLTYDLTDVPLRTIPGTQALAEQKVRSLSPEQMWWLDILHRGQLPGDKYGVAATPVSVLTNDYLDRTQKMGVNRRASETSLGMMLRRMCPGVARVRRTFEAGGARTWAQAFPPLPQCRLDFARQVVGSVEWADEDQEWEACQP